MSNIDEIPEEAGAVNWDKIEGKTEGKKPKKKKVEGLEEDILEEMDQLSEDEKSSPYPDEFLADVNFMRKDLGVGDYDISHLKEDPKAKDEE